MLHTIIQENNYQDSINLMLLTNEVNEMDGVKNSQVMMATDANKDIFKTSNLFTDELEKASPNDLAIVVDTEDESIIEKVIEKVNDFLSDLAANGENDTSNKKVRNWEQALEEMPDANLALISIPGIYAADEIERALDEGMNVFSFSDNVSLEDEVRLKKKAHEKGLILMGPDSGTGIISSVPLAFTNVVNPGNIGIVAASGTGIQEATTIIDALGGGVINAIGTGGRDLSEKVKAQTMLDSLIAMDKHYPTDIILVISKPPAEEVRNHVMEVLQSLSKPVVALFLGEKPTEHIGNVSLAYTLEEAAKMAVDLADGNGLKANYYSPIETNGLEKFHDKKTVKGLYSGGTLASESATLIADALNMKHITNEEGYYLRAGGFEVIDLGDDMYTQGRPHPMIDPSVRIEKIKEAVDDPTTGIILLDVVLGYGSHSDMAGALAPHIKEALDKVKEEGRTLYFISSIVGSDKDPQDYNTAEKTLKDAGAIVVNSNAEAVRLALYLMDTPIDLPDKERVEYVGEKIALDQPSEKVLELLNNKPRVINIGLEGFNEPILKYGGESVQFDWKPRAKGDKKLIHILNELDKKEIKEKIEKENQELASRMRESQPFLVDVKPGKELIPELNTGKKVILHAGPPIKYENMVGPMQGSCVGAMLFEGWATDEADARRQLENGEVTLIPCHHVGAVGPMGGITTANMPMLVIENKVDGTTGYSTLNEGIGKVLRFGAFSQEVIDRLNWMKDTLGPVMSKALATMEEGININVIVSKAITMGDEFHQRNIAASLIFMKEMTPAIVNLDISEKEKYDVIDFLAKTDQFFLNIMMATGKAIVDYARKYKKGTVVTTMSRNGENFGIRIAELGDEWFTAPVNSPRGLYFTGFTAEDGSKDIGDSSITETVGVGAMSTIAAPGVIRFVGGNGLKDAQNTSEEMQQIVVSNNPNWSIPNWDFKGAPQGIDIRKVVETGITPVINTGIAHKEPGKGQIGAGTVRAPYECFTKALVAYAKAVGIDVE